MRYWTSLVMMKVIKIKIQVDKTRTILVQTEHNRSSEVTKAQFLSCLLKTLTVDHVDLETPYGLRTGGVVWFSS